jgi:hypothetical protein
MAIATQQGLSPQAAVLGAFESDASHSKANGLSPRAGLLCLPMLSTHGYEVITRDAIAAIAGVLAEFLRRGFAAEPSGRRTTVVRPPANAFIGDVRKAFLRKLIGLNRRCGCCPPSRGSGGGSSPKWRQGS